MNYKKIEGYENYIIFKTGKVFSIKTKRFLKPSFFTTGYLKVDLYKKCKRKNIAIHRLLGLYFISNPNNLPCIDHINRNRTDNRLENLRWVSYKENGLNKTFRGGCIVKTNDKVKDKIYNYWRASFSYKGINKSKRFKLKEDAEKWLNENKPKP